MTSSKNKIVALFLTLFVVSCDGIKFNPDIYVGDFQNGAIINERGELVYATSPLFNQFGCMHKDKWLELSEILNRAKMSRKARRRIKKETKKLQRKFYSDTL